MVWAGSGLDGWACPKREKKEVKTKKRECTHLAYTRGPSRWRHPNAPGFGVTVTACCCDEYAAQNAAGKVLYREVKIRQ